MSEVDVAKIPVYVINLKSRTDRRLHIIREFSNRDEFTVDIVEAYENGAMGLWNTIKHILKNLAGGDDEFIILCEDDHQFTKHYSKEFLFYNIENARNRNADILSGGASWFNNAVEITDELFWIQCFTGLQFTIVFRKFFKQILEANLINNQASDLKISNLSTNKFMIYPFISTQREHGYSDVTPNNNVRGRVEKLFNRSSACIQNIKNVGLFYKTVDKKIFNDPEFNAFENITIPTYVINLPEREERRNHIIQQFLGRPEFDITIIEAVKNEIGALGLWQTIRKIIELAIKNEDDVIIICEDDHEFTKRYSCDYLLRNIFAAHEQGVDILSGGIAYFSQAVPITENRFWIDNFHCTQFIVVYQKLFQKILDEPFDEKVTADGILSEMTSNKMVLYPFISVQKEFGYSDATPNKNGTPGLMTMNFTLTKDRLKVIQYVRDKFLAKSRENGMQLSENSFREFMININNAQLQIPHS